VELIYTDIAELRFKRSELILDLKILEGAEMNLENTKRHFKIINELTENKKYMAAVDATNFFTVTPEGLHYSSQRAAISNRVASAHYNSSSVNKLTTNFFATYYRPPIPLKIFDTRKEAIAWLKMIYENNTQRM
jgi:hypothetical protein